MLNSLSIVPAEQIWKLKVALPMTWGKKTSSPQVDFGNMFWSYLLSVFFKSRLHTLMSLSQESYTGFKKQLSILKAKLLLPHNIFCYLTCSAAIQKQPLPTLQQNRVKPATQVLNFQNCCDRAKLRIALIHELHWWTTININEAIRALLNSARTYRWTYSFLQCTQQMPAPFLGYTTQSSH